MCVCVCAWGVEILGQYEATMCVVCVFNCYRSVLHSLVPFPGTEKRKARVWFGVGMCYVCVFSMTLVFV